MGSLPLRHVHFDHSRDVFHRIRTSSLVAKASFAMAKTSHKRGGTQEGTEGASERASKLRDEGNRLFAQKETKRALEQYAKALAMLPEDAQERTAIYRCGQTRRSSARTREIDQAVREE